MLSITINAKGRTAGDLQLVLDEIRMALDNGYTEGHDQNEDGGYEYQTSGVDEGDDDAAD